MDDLSRQEDEGAGAGTGSGSDEDADVSFLDKVNQSFNNQMPSSTMRDPYSIVQSSNGNARNPTDIRKYLIYGGLALVAIITIKFLVKR